MWTSVSPWVEGARRGVGELKAGVDDALAAAAELSVHAAAARRTLEQVAGRGSHSSTFRLNVSTFCWIRWVHDFPPVY
jgi:hypothetical protein